MTNALHSSATDEHGTPPEIVAIAHRVLVDIGIDPFSSPTWNAAIGAWRIITRAENGFTTPWVFGAPPPDRVVDSDHRAPKGHVETALVNPPGDRKGVGVAAAWRALSAYYRLGWITSALWVGFSLEQLSRLQRVGAPSHPLSWPTAIPSARIDYLKAPGVPNEDPTHASFLTLLPSSSAQVHRFAAAARELGAVINV